MGLRLVGVVGIAWMFAGQATASITVISQNRFSGSETVISNWFALWPGWPDPSPHGTFSTVGVRFENAGSTGGFTATDLRSQDAQGMFGAIPGASLGSYLSDAASWTDIQIIFTDPTRTVNRVGFLISNQGTFDMRVHGAGENDEHVSFSLVGGTFFGVETDWDIDFLEIMNVVGQRFVTCIDDFRFEAVPEPPPPPPASPIPEPCTLIVWSLLGASGVGIGWWRRKRKLRRV